MSKPLISPTRLGVWTAAAVCAGLVWSAAPDAQAQQRPCTKKERAEAQLLDVQAGGKFDSGDFRASLEAWQNAYTTCPNYVTAWNIARSYEELKALVQAREAFVLYKSFRKLPRNKRKRADDKINEIDGRLEEARALEEKGAASLKQNKLPEAIGHFEASVAIYNDPAVLGKIADAHEANDALEDAIEVLERRVLAAPGISNQVQTATRDRIARLRKTLEVRRNPPPPPGGGGAKTQPEDNTGLKIAGWSLVGLGGASLLFSGVTYLGASSDLDTLDSLDAQLAAGQESARSERDALASDLEGTNTLILVGYGVGAAALLGGAACLYLSMDSGEESAGTDATTTSSLRLMFAPNGAVLGGTF